MKKLILIFASIIPDCAVCRCADVQNRDQGWTWIFKSEIRRSDRHRKWWRCISLATGDGVAAYHVGIQTRIKIAMFFVQPELYFNDGGGTVDLVDSNGPSELLNIDLKRVDLPVILGVKLGPVRISAGPVGSYVLQDQSIAIEFVRTQ